MNNIIFIDATYIKYRRMWKTDRWKFSGDMVKLNIRLNREGLSAEEQHTLETMNRIVDEHDGNWMDGEEVDRHEIIPVRKRQPH